MTRSFTAAIYALAIIGFFLVLAVLPAHSAPLTTKQAGDTLSGSVVEFLSGSRRVCTAFKISSRQFMTAKHCVTQVNREYKIDFNNRMSFVRSILVSGVDKEDWAVANVATSNDKIKSLSLGCNDELYLGMPVAYAGYPSPLELTMGLGAVTSVTPVKPSRSNADFMIDVAAAPGASGSPVISLDTGNVIGILTEGIRNRKTGFFMVGIESIKSTAQCDDVVKPEVAPPEYVGPF